MTRMEKDYDAEIVVLGAGVLGLTSALSLARAGFTKITVIAKCMPQDYDSEYTSPWAAANWVPVSKEGSIEAEWDLLTWKELYKLATEVPAAGVWLQGKTSYYRNKDAEEDPDWFHNTVLGYRLLSKSEVPSFADWGKFYRTISLDPSIYLHYLYSMCLSKGVSFHRATVSHIKEAFTLQWPRPWTHKSKFADVVVNCTGLLASKLGGVMDERVVPMRGQLVVVANESGGMFGLSGADDMHNGLGECCYVIPRPAGGGTVIGGSSHLTWSKEPDLELSARMMKRAIEICPQLVPPGAGIEALQVVRHQVGLRPFRMGGPRVEKETLHDDGLGELRIVHCYGAGGFGFQASYGMADSVTKLVHHSLGMTSML